MVKVFVLISFLADLVQVVGVNLRDLWHKWESMDRRNRWIVGLFVSMLSVVIALVIALRLSLTRQSLRSVYQDKVVILVAEFSEGATDKIPDDRMVTHRILTELRKLEVGDPGLVIVELGQVVLDPDAALRLGKEQGAVAVIWGTYTRSATHVLVEPHFKVVSSPVNVYAEGHLKEPEERVVDIEYLEDFSLHFELSQEMSHLSAFVAGLTHYWEKSFDEALADFETALEIAAKDQASGLESIHYYRGQIFREKERYTEAEEEFSESIRINPMFAAGHNALGLVYREQDRTDEAIEQYLRAIDADPRFASTYNNLAVAYGEQDKPVEVRLELYLKTLEIEPDNFVCHRNLGLLYESQDRYDEALAEYQAAIHASYPYDAESYFLLASLYWNLARWTEAQQACQKALELDSDHAAARNLLGVLYFGVGSFKKAVTEFEKALEIDPNYASAHSNLGLAYEYEDEPEAAQTEYKKAMSLDSENPIYSCRLGALFVEVGQIEEGEKLIAECQRLVALYPEDAQNHNELGMAYLEREDYHEALLEFQQAIQLDPDNYGYHSNLSSTYEELGQLQEAINEAKQVLRLSPNPFYAHLNLRTLHWAARDYRGVTRESALAFLAAPIDFKLAIAMFLVVLSGAVYVLVSRQRRKEVKETTAFVGYVCILALMLVAKRGLSKIVVAFPSSPQIVSRALSRVNRLVASYYYSLGNIIISQGREGGVEMWQRAFDTEPSYPPAAHALVDYFGIRKRDLQAAYQIAHQAIATESHDALMHIKLGDICLALDIFEESIRRWEGAVQIDADAVIDFQLGQFQAGIYLAHSHFTLGLAYKAKGEISKAQAGFELTISFTDNSALKRAAQKELETLQAEKSRAVQDAIAGMEGET